MADLALLGHLENFISKDRKQRFLKVLQYRTRFITVAVEDIYQLHNTSAVLRSCEVFGVQDLHLIERRFGKRLDRKIAMGAQQWVTLYRHTRTKDCIEALRSRGYRIVATSPAEIGDTLEEFIIDRPAALFFGTEKEGLSSEVLEAADAHLRIPMAGFTESLNISVAAAIILYQFTNEVRNSQLDWQLSESEMLELRLAWTIQSVKGAQAIIRRFRGIG